VTPPITYPVTQYADVRKASLLCGFHTVSRYRRKCNLIYAPVRRVRLSLCQFSRYSQICSKLFVPKRAKIGQQMWKGRTPLSTGRRPAPRLHDTRHYLVSLCGHQVVTDRTLSKSDENCGNASKTSCTP